MARRVASEKWVRGFSHNSENGGPNVSPIPLLSPDNSHGLGRPLRHPASFQTLLLVWWLVTLSPLSAGQKAATVYFLLWCRGKLSKPQLGQGCVAAPASSSRRNTASDITGISKQPASPAVWLPCWKGPPWREVCSDSLADQDLTPLASPSTEKVDGS